MDQPLIGMDADPRVAVVTGGAQGIGRAIVERLFADGFKVAVLDRDTEAVAELRQDQRIHTRLADVSDPEAVADAFREVRRELGHVGLLVNNAGVMEASEPIEEIDFHSWRRVLAINLDAAFLCSRQATSDLRRTRGSIVNIASTRALMSEPNTLAYSASKGGLLALTHALAISLGPEIRVNAISPGWIAVSELQKSSQRSAPELSEADHAQHPVGRVGRGADVASMVAYLSSDAAGFITGQNFVVDGGMTKKMIYVE